MVASSKKEENEEILSLQQQLQTLKKLLKIAQSNSGPENSQKEIISLKALLNQESHAKEEALQELENVYVQFRQLKESYLLLQKQQKKEGDDPIVSDVSQEVFSPSQPLSEVGDNLEQLKQHCEQAEKRIALLLKDNERLAEQSSKASKAQEESEEQLKIAHYHLAKRVKEAAELSDKLDSAQQEVILLNNRLHDANDRVQTLETELEQARQAYMQKQLKYEDAINASENLAAEWETKYFKLYDKLQETIAGAKELQKIEEKYYRMQALLGGINTLFEEPAAPAKPMPVMPENGIPLSFPKEAKRPYQNLFDLSRPG